MSIFTPTNQIKLTNVSVVRLKKGGQRFEMACYKNKVLEYRRRITLDLDEVLQSSIVFTNVSKGQAARAFELESAFGDMKPAQIIEEILAKGEIQVSAQERKAQQEQMTREVATIIANKCVDPRTKRPYPAGIIEQALGEVHFSPNLTRSAKQQALELIKQLQKQGTLPLERAQMRLLVVLDVADAQRVADELRPMVAQIEHEDRDEHSIRSTLLIDPGVFKQVTEAVARLSKGRGSVQTQSLKVVKEEEE